MTEPTGRKPWMAVERVFEEHGYPCIVGLTDGGWRVGYVFVRPDHPLYMKNYNLPPFTDWDVHGGVTFCGYIALADWEQRLPPGHTLNESMPSGFAIGLDFLHGDDRPDFKALRDFGPTMPGWQRIWEKTWPKLEGHVWSADECEQEIRKLANHIMRAERRH